jgi:hypothetical protein
MEMETPRNERRPSSEISAMMQKPMSLIPASGSAEEAGAELDAVKDAFFPPEYRAELEQQDFKFSTQLSRNKMALVAQTPREVPLNDNDLVRVFVKCKNRGIPYVEVTRGGGEHPVAIYELPPTLKDAQIKIRKIIEDLPRAGSMKQ